MKYETSIELRIIADFIEKRAKTCSEAEAKALDTVSDNAISILRDIFQLEFGEMIEEFSRSDEEIAKLESLYTAFEKIKARK